MRVTMSNMYVVTVGLQAQDWTAMRRDESANPALCKWVKLQICEEMAAWQHSGQLSVVLTPDIMFNEAQTLFTPIYHLYQYSSFALE